MSRLRRFNISAFRATVLGTIGGIFLRCYGLLLRKLPPIGQNGEPAEKISADGGVFLFWHNRQLLFPYFFATLRPDPNQPTYVLISRHADGRIIAQAVRHFGIRSIAGSSSRGARAASKEMLAKLSEGANIVITPDGPKGPRYKMKSGALELARSSKKPIYPLACSASAVWQFGSWDRMQLPKPGSTLVTVIGDPIVADENLELEQVEAALMRVTEIADRHQFSDRQAS